MCVLALPLSGMKNTERMDTGFTKIFFTSGIALRSDAYCTQTLITSYLHAERIYLKNHLSLELCLNERKEPAASVYS